MISKKYITLIFLCLIVGLISSGKFKDRNLPKPMINDHYNYIAINEVMMWVSNNGDGSHDPITDGNGFYWPGGEEAEKAAIFEDGLIWGCIVGGDTLVNGNTHRQGLQAGKILPDGTADNPDDPRYRVYKIQKNWEDLQPGPERDSYEKDYNEWPVQDGAPWVDVDGDGIFSSGVDQPDFNGDQVLWYVANDMDTSRSISLYGSESIGLEFQTTVYGFNRSNFLKDVVFKKYLIINKSTIQIDSMYLAYWSDDDLGDASDDFVGCDTLLNLGYTYNGDNIDSDGSEITYGISPPAVGHMVVQGPVTPTSQADSAWFQNKWKTGHKNLSMTSFYPFIFSGWSHPGTIGAIEMYRFMGGYTWTGNSFIDPHTGLATKFIVPGDPVAGEGWYEGAGWPGGEDPADRSSMISSGPFTMAPGDSQEVTIAILIARGDDYLDSITELKSKAPLVQFAYNSDFQNEPEMDKPATKTVTSDKSLTLYWEPNVEDFDKIDPLLQNQEISNFSYTFEGYRVWQYRDMDDIDPRLLATFDIKNDVDIIYEWGIINGHLAKIVAIDGPNEGVRRSFTITDNIFNQKSLNNANPYYFAVTAYAYSEFSDPSFVESEPEIIEVIPGLQKIDETLPYDSGDTITADHVSGLGDGSVELIVVDPNALTGDQYRVVLEGEVNDLSYSFINYTTNNTILTDCTNFVIDKDQARIIDGFFLNLHNTGKEKIDALYPYQTYAIRDVLEVKSPDGVDLPEPVDLFENFNSTGAWRITSYGVEKDRKQNINVNDQIGYQNYEIRFTAIGSDYYLTGSTLSFSPWRADDPIAPDRAPFEIWDLGRTESAEDDIRLAIKTMDDYSALQDDSSLVDQDGKWSRLENGDWEPIFAFFQDSTYTEPLPETSGRISNVKDSRLGKIVIRGELPEEGTVIRIQTWKPLTSEDAFSVIATAPNPQDYSNAKTSLDDISVFPNPLFGFSTMSGYLKQDFMRFTNMPVQVSVRIFSLGGTYVRRIEKNDDNPYLDWDLKNNAGQQVASGVYIAHLEMPNIGEKVMKLAIVLEEQR